MREDIKNRLTGAVRQFRHNSDNSPDTHNPREGFVFGYDRGEVDELVVDLLGELEAARAQQSDDKPYKLIRLSERLPTEEDADDLKQVWFCKDPNRDTEVRCGFRDSGSHHALTLEFFYVVSENAEKYLRYWTNACWARTGLTSPAAPDTGGAHE